MYRLQEGIELTQVADQYMLVALQPLWDDVPRMIQITKFGAIVITLIQKETSYEDILLLLRVYTKLEENIVKEKLDDYLQYLESIGYLKRI